MMVNSNPGCTEEEKPSWQLSFAVCPEGERQWSSGSERTLGTQCLEPVDDGD